MSLIRDGEKGCGGRGYGGGGAGAGERLYTYRYIVTARMTHALRWAAMRAILMFHNYEEQLKSQDSVHRLATVFEEKGEPKRLRTEAPPLTSLTALPLGQTRAHRTPSDSSEFLLLQ